LQFLQNQKSTDKPEHKPGFSSAAFITRGDRVLQELILQQRDERYGAVEEFSAVAGDVGDADNEGLRGEDLQGV
jgi:hypothetical protein